jgi:hypothetical protein
MFMHSCDDNIKINFLKIRHYVDLVRLMRERDQFRTVVNTVVIIRFHEGHRIARLAKQLLTFQERFGTLELGESSA